MADLTTTAAVKAWAGITGSGDDSAIDGIVTACSALLHGIVGHDYESTGVTAEHHSGAASGAIVLKKPAASITEVREGTVTLDSDAYELESERLLWRKANGYAADWAVGRRNIEVDYTPTSTVPADLELCAREVCAWIVKQSGLDSGASRLGLSAQANADTGTADYFAQALRQLPMSNATLRRYKRYA